MIWRLMRKFLTFNTYKKFLKILQAIWLKSDFLGERAVFAGDDGNDHLDVFTCGLQTILVKNATDNVRNEAIDSLFARECSLGA